MSKKYVSKDLSEQIHKKAEPFLTWLKDAEEESESEVIFILFFDYLKKVSELIFKQDSYVFCSESGRSGVLLTLECLKGTGGL